MSDIDISEPLSDLLAPLNNEQREFLMNNYTIQTYKKNETIYCEGETPSHLMCLITGKVKIFKDGVGGRSQIIRMIKQREYFAYRAYFAKEDFVTAAAAFEPSVICLIPMTAITTLIAQNNDLAMFFIRQLSLRKISDSARRPRICFCVRLTVRSSEMPRSIESWRMKNMAKSLF